MTNEKIIQGSRAGKRNGKAFRIGIVTSLFNGDVTLSLETGAKQALQAADVSPDNIVVVRVPGAFEIPLAVKSLFESRKVDGVVAVGAVIRGETSHYDYVCNAVERGCSQLMLEYRKPVGFGILTTDDENQAHERAGGKQGNKGEEAALVVLEMLNTLMDIDAPLRK